MFEAIAWEIGIIAGSLMSPFYNISNFRSAIQAKCLRIYPIDKLPGFHGYLGTSDHPEQKLVCKSWIPKGQPAILINLTAG